MYLGGFVTDFGKHGRTNDGNEQYDYVDCLSDNNTTRGGSAAAADQTRMHMDA